MTGCLAARPPFKRTFLAFSLCVLAFLFAFEAKLAWYSPAGDPGIQISAAKALRADSPALISNGNAAHDHAQEQATNAALACVIAPPAPASNASEKRLASSTDRSEGSPVILVPSIDFRPPPVA